ncbi:MAG: hypothetical protein JXR63_12815 [Spirochaetales bacterium]|nr:hypothetical protein [Spirochaetales bacterium]
MKVKNLTFIVALLFSSCGNNFTSKVFVPLPFSSNSRETIGSPTHGESYFYSYIDLIGRVDLIVISNSTTILKMSSADLAESASGFEFELPANREFTILLNFFDNDNQLLYTGSSEVYISDEHVNEINITLVKNRSFVNIFFDRFPSLKSQFSGEQLTFLETLETYAERELSFNCYVGYDQDFSVGYDYNDIAVSPFSNFIVDGYGSYYYDVSITDKSTSENYFWASSEFTILPGEIKQIYPSYQPTTVKVYMDLAEVATRMTPQGFYYFDIDSETLLIELAKVASYRLSLFFIKDDRWAGEYPADDPSMDPNNYGLKIDSATVSSSVTSGELALNVEKLNLLAEPTSTYGYIVVRFELLDSAGNILFIHRPFIMLANAYDNSLFTYSSTGIDLLNGVGSDYIYGITDLHYVGN